MTTFSYSTDSPANVRTGLLVLPMFHGPKGPLPGPGVKEVGLEQAYRDAKLTGKQQENLLVVRRDGDRFTAGAVLLVGAGDKAELTSNVVRRVLGRAASAFPRFGTVATTFPQAVTGKGAVDAMQAAVEGIVLGSYRFDRYKTATSETKPLTRITVLGSAQGRREGRARGRQARAGRRRGRVLGARPGEHAGRRHAARADRARGAEDGARGRAPLQGLGQARAGEGRVRRHPRRRRRQREPAAHDRALVQGRRHRDAHRAHRQGHRVRLRRPVDQGRQGHGDDEVRHGRRRVDPRHDEGDRAPQAEDQRDRRDPVVGEHAERLGDEARRRADAPRRHDVGGVEHRRRGTAGAGRRARVPRREEAEGDHRHRHAHGRVHDRAGRSDHRRHGQRRRAVP